MSEDGQSIEIRTEADVARSVVAAQRLARSLGFKTAQSFLAATAVSELARNIFQYAGQGNIRLSQLSDGERVGLQVEAEDHGPGIADIELAMTEGYSTGNTLGLGLPGVRRIMDELDFDADREVGTRIVGRKWR